MLHLPLALPLDADPAPNGVAHPARPVAGVIEPLLWTIEEAALALRTSVRTLKRMVAAGELPPNAVVRLGARRRLFVVAALKAWCARGCPPVSSGAPRRRKRPTRKEKSTAGRQNCSPA